MRLRMFDVRVDVAPSLTRVLASHGLNAAMP